MDRKFLDEAIGKYLIEKQIGNNEAFEVLKEKVTNEFGSLNLNKSEIEILKKIGDNKSARPKEHKIYGIQSMQQFSSVYLTKLHKQNLLTREQKGQAVLYSLNGLSLLAYSYQILDS